MRLSAQLKAKDYRDLLEIIDLTYGASCPEALFPPLFEELSRAIGCTTGVFMFGESGLPRVRGAFVFQTSHATQLAREFAEYYWALEPFWATGFLLSARCCHTWPARFPSSSCATRVRAQRES